MLTNITQPTSKLAHLAQSLPGRLGLLHHGQPAGGHQSGLAALVHHLEDLVPPGVVCGSLHFDSTLLCSSTVHLFTNYASHRQQLETLSHRVPLMTVDDL